LSSRIEVEMNFSNLSVVVTGASGGLGRAMAVGFARDGATVIGFGRSVQGLEATQALCPSGKMFFAVGDLTRQSDVEALFAEADRRAGRVDVLVNNGARYPKVGFVGEPFGNWEHAVVTNVIGTARCCHLALPGMLNRGFGRIVNVGTFAWMGPIPNASAYSTSKGAIRPLTQSLASEVDRSQHPDVLINEFIPGTFRTGMSETGEEPAAVYPHLRFVVSLPSGGPTGQTFFKSDMLQDPVSLKRRIKRTMSRVSFGLLRAE
jgi:NAD(P)-dependent dehydrogenase (short-subunit alcohol dehydrogenase family)